ncbi:MAG: hypothetical protein KDI51_11525 [Xanthomonadales bacterium]|nr:hypothetical protein [Xanthomonadales bacterium]MCB1787440.1 hypothetical protein [Gammaproteobacteria bacterium]
MALSIIEIVYAKRAKFPEEIQTLGDLQQSGRYPFVEDGTIKELKVHAGPDQFQVKSEDSTCRVLTNAARTVAARVMATKLTFFDADYADDFGGTLSRLRDVLDCWAKAATALTLSELRLRTLDVAVPPQDVDLARWLRPSWHAGDLGKSGSQGMAIRDTALADGVMHVRVRTAEVEPGQKVIPPPDLMTAVHVRLPKSLMGPFDRPARVAIVDVERVIGVEGLALERIESLLTTAHAETKAAFESVFEDSALDYFRGDDVS